MSLSGRLTAARLSIHGQRLLDRPLEYQRLQLVACSEFFCAQCLHLVVETLHFRDVKN